MSVADVHQQRRRLDQKHDQDLRDTWVMLLDRAGCDLLTICDIGLNRSRGRALRLAT
ncbi:hypothetical protein [Bradyrhizobium icense]|uniref:hypothetical protein n=1 Tax=Bradyrhizobium icense TaxID=1274631 RepID=UPI000B2ED831|nr:hypothetical protein [Bradyrhizobium icense]